MHQATHYRGHLAHSHGAIDPSIASSHRVGLFTAAAVQLAIMLLPNSVSLFADTIHHFGDTGTDIHTQIPRSHSATLA